MPKAFDNCVKNGGRIKTIKPRSDVYIKVCWLNGKSYPGEVHHNKEEKK